MTMSAGLKEVLENHSATQEGKAGHHQAIFRQGSEMWTVTWVGFLSEDKEESVFMDLEKVWWHGTLGSLL